MSKSLKAYFETDSEQTRCRHRKRLQKLVDQLSECSDRMGLVVNEIVFIEKKEVDLKLYKLKTSCFRDNEPSRSSDVQLRFNAQKTRDYCNLSERKYILFKKMMGFEKIMPGIKGCIEIKKNINSFFEISSNQKGFFLKNPMHKITLVILNFYNQNNNFEENKFSIKIACDSTNINSKNMKQLNLTFTLINDKKTAMSAKGNFLLGMFKIEKEDYETLRVCLSEIFEKLQSVSSIKIKEKNYAIEHFLGGDMKSVSLLYGINGANSNQPCVLCLWNKNDLLDVSKIYEGRTLTMSKSMMGQNGFINEAITYIENDHCSPEMLHLFIR